MEDREVLGSTSKLVIEGHERLNQLEVNLDQRWDLLGQRRVLREGAYNRDEAKVRDEKSKNPRRLPAVTSQPGRLSPEGSLA